MNFADKVADNNEGILLFLKEFGFVEDDKHVYRNGYYSSNRLYYNRVTVFIEGHYVKAVNHQGFNVGGETGTYRAEMELEGVTKDMVLELINEVLPADLD